MPDSDVNDFIFGLERTLAQFTTGLGTRIAALDRLPEELGEIHTQLASQATSISGLTLKIALVGAVTFTVFALISRAGERLSGSGGRTPLSIVFAAAAALIVGFATTHLLADSFLITRTLRFWTINVVALCVLLIVLRAVILYSVRFEFRDRPIHLVRLARSLSFVIGWAIVGLGVIATLRLWRAGQGLLDIVGTGFVGLPVLVLLVATAWRYKRTLCGAVAGRRPRSRRLSSFARVWPIVIICLIAFILVNSEIAKTLNVALPGVALLLTVLIAILTPHLDTMIRSWARQGLRSSETSIIGAALRQTARFLSVVVTVALLGILWAVPLASGFGIDLSLVVADAAKVGLIALAAAFLWNAVASTIARISLIEHKVAGDDQKTIPRSRLGTLVPLLSAISKATIVSFALLSALVSVGINVWPLVTGLSFFGLAVGFGSQTLVKDVVSGLFFLIDDAFRSGEYIEVSGSKGMVEKISIRSVSLRDSSGSLTTIPYGQMTKIQNFSRDWAVEKLSFRLAFDTDMEIVRKLFADIGEELSADPEVAPHMLEPFMSQGIAEVEDGAIVIRARFTAKPGKQSIIRRAALRAIHNAFQKNGIRTGK